MTTPNSGPISQLPVATSINTGMMVPCDNPLVLPYGQTQKFTISQLTDYFSVNLLQSNILSAIAATTGNLNAAYINGNNGVGATLINVGALGALIIDGVTMQVGNRVLVSQQSISYQNGVYVVTAIGSVAIPWVLTRASDYDNHIPGQIDQGDFIGILFGTTNALTWWFMVSPNPVTVGVTPIVFERQGSGDFPFTQVQFVAKGGNDANAGNLMGAPKLTIQAAINALGLSPSVTGLVWVLDSGSYDESLTSTYSFELYAPNAQIISNGGDLLTINNSGINTITTITCWQFGKFSPGGLAVNLLGAQSNLFLNAKIIQGDMYIEGGFVDGNIAQVASNVHVASTGKFGPTIFNAIFLTLTVDAGGTVAGNIQQIIGPGNVVNDQYGNQIIHGSLNINNAYTLPTIDASSNGYVLSRTAPGVVAWQPVSADIPFNDIEIFVSQTIGNDANSGSYLAPLATFGAAITLASAHAGCIIIGLDDATYNENLLQNTDFNIYAPLASLIPSSGDAITVNDYSFNPSITFKNIRISSGSCLNLNGGGPSGSVYLYADTIDGSAGAAVYNGENGNCYINCNVLNGILLTGGSGFNYYETKTRSGTDSSQTLGISVSGSTSPIWTVPSIAFNPTTQGIVGTTVADNASSGYVGEFISSVVSSGSAVSIPDDTDVDVTSIALTAGDWDIHGNVYFIDAGNFIRGVAWCSTTSSSMPDKSLTNQIAIAANTSEQGISTPYLRVNVSSPTTVYLSCHAVFSSTMGVCGGIYARRVR